MTRGAGISLGLAGVIALSGCITGPSTGVLRNTSSYLSVDTRLLQDDLVNFRVEMAGLATQEQVSKFAECAAAQYTLIRGYGFARHLRTTVNEEGGIWRGDAVYTISPTLPRGLRTIDAEVVVADCAEQGIPTV